MPKVGNKKFPYTPAGKKAAKAYAAGEKMESKSEKMMEMKKGMKKTAKKAAMKKMGKKKQSWLKAKTTLRILLARLIKPIKHGVQQIMLLQMYDQEQMSVPLLLIKKQQQSVVRLLVRSLWAHVTTQKERELKENDRPQTKASRSVRL